MRFAERHARGARVWAVEGAGHYGAGLTRYLEQRGETVLEVGRSSRGERRLRGKDDPLDAIRAARSALASETRRCRAPVSARRLCACCCSRGAAPSTCAGIALVQLRSVIVTAPEQLRERAAAAAARRS